MVEVLRSHFWDKYGDTPTDNVYDYVAWIRRDHQNKLFFLLRGVYLDDVINNIKANPDRDPRELYLEARSNSDVPLCPVEEVELAEYKESRSVAEAELAEYEEGKALVEAVLAMQKEAKSVAEAERAEYEEGRALVEEALAMHDRAKAIEEGRLAEYEELKAFVEAVLAVHKKAESSTSTGLPRFSKSK